METFTIYRKVLIVLFITTPNINTTYGKSIKIKAARRYP